MIRAVSFSIVILLACAFTSAHKCHCKQPFYKTSPTGNLMTCYPVYQSRIQAPGPPIKLGRKFVNAVLESTCTSDFDKAINEIKKTVRCKPRDVMIDLITSDGSKVFPYKATVKKCGGLCGRKVCLAKKQRGLKIPVRIKTGRNWTCSYQTVMEDVACQCGCPEETRNCVGSQEFVESSCQCICKTDHIEMQKCQRKNDHYWDPIKCSCFCLERPCTTGSKWSQRECRCVRP